MKSVRTIGCDTMSNDRCAAYVCPTHDEPIPREEIGRGFPLESGE